MNGITSPRQPRSHGRFFLAALVMTLAVCGGAFSLSRGSASAGSQPDFLLPWQDGQTWLTGSAGFHATNDAIDFFPPDTPLGGIVKCEGDPDWVFEESSYYVLAPAAGEVVQASNALVLIDHGGGWFSRAYHMTGFVVEAGDYVSAGQRLARPSTLGSCSSGPHDHFWVQGPNGETTKDVTLSGIPTTEIGVNEYITDTGNFEPETGPTPTPIPSVSPPSGPTETPTEAPTPTPIPILRGDANCDHKVNALDATTILRMLAEDADGGTCGGAVTADTDCDDTVTTTDALAILHDVSGVKVLPDAPCKPPSPPVPTETPVPTEAPTPRGNTDSNAAADAEQDG